MTNLLVPKRADERMSKNHIIQTKYFIGGLEENDVNNS